MKSYNSYAVSGINHKVDIFSDMSYIQSDSVINRDSKSVFNSRTVDDESYMDISERECDD